MNFTIAAMMAVLIGGGLLAALITMIVHPRAGQLFCDDWLPESEGGVDVFEEHGPAADAPLKEGRTATPSPVR